MNPSDLKEGYMRHLIRRLTISLLSLSLAILIIGCDPSVTSTIQTSGTIASAESATVAWIETSAEPVSTFEPSSENTIAATSAAPTVTPVPTTRPSPTAAPTTKPSPTAIPADPSAIIHKNALVIDTHNDTVLKIIGRDSWLPQINIANKTSFMVDIPKLKAGGIDMSTFAAYTSGYSLSSGGQDFARANSRLLALLNAGLWTISQNSRSIDQIRRFTDIAAAVDNAKIGVLLSIEGAYSLHGDTANELLRQYRDLGVLMLSPVWSNSNALGEGVNERFKDGPASSGGLTPLGSEIIAEMNRLGIVVDVSHMNDETFWDTVSVSSAPVIASHSSVYSLCPNVRNLKDSQIEAIAAGGGVIQVNFHRPFLAVDESAATLSTLVDHIDYVARLAGIDHVGLGSDFDGAKMPQGLPDAAAYPRITQELFKRGYTEAEIRKILGGNIARVLESVWANAPATISGTSVIEPALAMGSSVSSATPMLTAIVGKPEAIDAASLRVIVDGTVYTPEFDPATGLVSLTVTTALSEKFHVLTFAVTSTDGAQVRETRIFYIA